MPSVADYYIAKGPIDKLEVRLNEFITGLESRPDLPPAEKKVLQTGGVFWAGTAFVTANSPDELKQRFPTVASNNDAGVSEAIARWLQQKKTVMSQSYE